VPKCFQRLRPIHKREKNEPCTRLTGSGVAKKVAPAREIQSSGEPKLCKQNTKDSRTRRQTHEDKSLETGLALGVCVSLLVIWHHLRCDTSGTLGRHERPHWTVEWSGNPDSRTLKTPVGETTGPWHYHPGYVYNVVRQGTITVEDGCGNVQSYSAGQAFETSQGVSTERITWVRGCHRVEYVHRPAGQTNHGIHSKQRAPLRPTERS